MQGVEGSKKVKSLGDVPVRIPDKPPYVYETAGKDGRV